MDIAKRYGASIWRARYFWYHLVKADLRIKYRRSKLGLLWSLLHPLMVTLLLAAVIGTIFKSPFWEYAPFVYSGLVLWEVFVGSFMTGAMCIINAEAYIKQYKHPLAIYTLKQALVNLTNFWIGFSGVVVWCLVMKPENIGVSLIALPISTILLFSLIWGICTLSAMINTKFRDFQQLIMIVTQALWFISPVYFEPKVFIQAGIPEVVNYNPITHILNLFRAPLLEGAFPSGLDYIHVIGCIILMATVAIYKIYKEENELIFYL